MKSALIAIGKILVGLAIMASAFLVPAVLVGYLYLKWSERGDPYDGQGGISASICGFVAGIPAALLAGYLWLSHCLDQMLKDGTVPARSLK